MISCLWLAQFKVIRLTHTWPHLASQVTGEMYEKFNLIAQLHMLHISICFGFWLPPFSPLHP